MNADTRKLIKARKALESTRLALNGVLSKYKLPKAALSELETIADNVRYAIEATQAEKIV